MKKLLITLFLFAANHSIQATNTKKQIVALVAPHGLTEKNIDHLLEATYPGTITTLNNWLLAQHSIGDRAPKTPGGIQATDAVANTLSKVMPLLAQYQQEKSSVS